MHIFEQPINSLPASMWIGIYVGIIWVIFAIPVIRRVAITETDIRRSDPSEVRIMACLMFFFSPIWIPIWLLCRLVLVVGGLILGIGIKMP